MAGMTIVPVGVDSKGNIDIEELRQKAEEHKDRFVLFSWSTQTTSPHRLCSRLYRTACAVCIHTQTGFEKPDVLCTCTQKAFCSTAHKATQVNKLR